MARGKKKQTYRVVLHPDAMPAVRFDAPADATRDDLAELAAGRFMDWFDTVDWTAGKPLIGYLRDDGTEVGDG